MATKFDKILGQLREQDSGTGTGGAVDSVNGQTGTVVLTTNNISDSTNKRYVTDAQKTVITNTSGTNTGDQDLSSYATTSALTSGLSGKANTTHTHAISDVTSLQTALDGKQAAGSYAAASHTHTASQVTDFQATVSANTDVAANTTARHTHSNKTTLDSITAAYTTAEQTKLSGIASGATVGADWNTNVSNKPTLGTAAAKNIPASGNASATEVVYGTDTRLTDARTPTTHTHAESDITNLTTDLAGKASVSHTHTKSQVTDFTHSITGSEHTFPGGTTNFLRSDGTFAAPTASAAWGSITGTLSSQTDLQSAIDAKQATLVSGTNIKTINGSSVMGSGDLTVSGNDSRILVARKTAAQAITGTIGNVTDMALTLAAASTYYVYICMPVTTVSGTSPTLQLGFTGPASPTLVHLRRSQMTSATAMAFAVITSFTTFAAGAAVANTMHTVEGIVVTSAGNGGTLQLRAAAAGTTPSITIPAGASMYAIKTA